MFEKRSTEKEWMDELDSSGTVIIQTLKELDYINRKLGGNNVSINGLKKLLKNTSNYEITLADLGCGGGDILKEITKWADKKGFTILITGIDANENIIEYARENCINVSNIHFETLNIFSEKFKKQYYDVYHTSLFTHHFTDNELVSMLKTWYSNCNIGIIINDLHRHWFAYYSIKWLTKFFSKSPMVQNDAAVSVQRGFTKNELIQLLQKADISNFTIRWNWAFRWQVVCFK